ncbi:hypothetical protein EJP82_00325 [Paenibacillus anaericanus]|uniref:Uncharacterized protein n=1 Tax=Paenibacillus anaericanus TaxID=170367 RepID=A0A433YEZ1_9BACL|nr:hypothetical protein [Paenibacillus anaericanus]RUT48430.1 hypothetical protein EJP82_00325 [Paenibacillus anaericanus]
MNELKKYIVTISFSLIFIALIGVLFYNQSQIRQTPTIYVFDIETDDFYIKDIEFVVLPDYIYVAKQYLEVIGENKVFDGVSYGLSIGENMIVSLSQADDPFHLPDTANGKIYYNTNNLFENMKVSKEDSIHVEIHYKVNGESKDVVGEIKLSDVVKPFTLTGERKPIHLQ